MKRFDRWAAVVLLTLFAMTPFAVTPAWAGEPTGAANYATQIPGFWRELGTSMTLDGELEPSEDYWYFKPDGTLATQGTALFGGEQPYRIEGDRIHSDAIGTFIIVSLEGDRLVLRGTLGGFWHLERRHFDPGPERSGRYYEREQVTMVVAEAVCVWMRNPGAYEAAHEEKLLERLERRGLSSLDKARFEASVNYYSDDPEFVTRHSAVLAEKMRSCRDD